MQCRSNKRNNQELARGEFFHQLGTDEFIKKYISYFGKARKLDDIRASAPWTEVWEEANADRMGL